MLDLRTLDPARQSADRRVALVAGFVIVATCTLASVAAGGGGWALAWGGAAALGGLPWFFAFGARWRLLDDALAASRSPGAATAWACGRPPRSRARSRTLSLFAALGCAGALALLVLPARRRALHGADRLVRGPLRARDLPRPHRPRDCASKRITDTRAAQGLRPLDIERPRRAKSGSDPQ